MADKNLNPRDGLRRNAVKDSSAEVLSPMDPPDAYAPPGKINIDPEQMHPFLKTLMADHAIIKESLADFEKAILSIKQSGVTKEVNRRLAHFFYTFNDIFIPHDKMEERRLFPALEKKLIEKGEHSQGAKPATALDVMEDDHLKAVQQAAVIFNFFGLASRLGDEISRNLVMDAAMEQANQFIELMQLHIFREDTIIFPLAHKYIDSTQLTKMQQEIQGDVGN